MKYVIPLPEAIRYLRGTISTFDRANDGLPYNLEARKTLMVIRAAEAAQFYRRQRWILMVVVIISVCVGLFAAKNDPVCRGIEAKIQHLIQNEQAVDDLYLSPASDVGND